MKAVLLRETGGPDRLEYTDVAEPSAASGQALVRVRAAGINFLDVLVRQGRYPQPPPLPTVPGGEVAGEVHGRRVIGLLDGGCGGYAELAAVDERWLVPLPDDASFEEGASFLMTFLTAWLPLTRHARAERGRTVLVHAAAGGVGSAAVQVARHLGADVVATASSEEKREFARSLGAQATYGYDEFTERVRADVVVDPVGGDVFAQSLRTLNPGGTLVAIGFAGGAWPEVDPALLVGRNIGVHGFYLGRLMGRRPELVRAAIDELLAVWRDGAFRPVVGAVFPLAEAADAHRLIEERHHRGKVVLVP
jgi:NADPH2:quinone reductase